MLFVPDEHYVRQPDHTTDANITSATTSTNTPPAAAAAAGDDVADDAANDDEDEDVFDEKAFVSASLLFASQAQYLGHSSQVTTYSHYTTDSSKLIVDELNCLVTRGVVCVRQSVLPVTGMLTVYEDQLRFDVAVDSCSHLANNDETSDDESVTSVRLERELINRVDISDSSPTTTTTTTTTAEQLEYTQSVCLSIIQQLTSNSLYSSVCLVQQRAMHSISSHVILS